MSSYYLNDTSKKWKVTARTLLSNQDLDISVNGNIRLNCTGNVILNGSNYPKQQFNFNLPLDISNSNYTVSATYLNTYLPILSASERTITIPAASNYTGSSFEIANANTNGLDHVLSCATIFSGTWGSDLNSMRLPPTSSVKLYSDGTNWVAYQASKTGWAKSTTPNPRPDDNQWYRSYISVIISGNNNIVFTKPPKAKWEGLRATFVEIQSGGAYYTAQFAYNSSTQAITCTPIYLIGYVMGTIDTIPQSYYFRQAPFLSVKKTSVILSRTISGTVICSNNRRTINITVFPITMGTIAFNTVINISGTNYTIVSIGRCTNGTATWNSSSQITVANITGNEGKLSPGTPLTFTDSSNSEITVLTTPNYSTWSVVTNSVNAFTNLAFTAPNGLGNTGTYGLNLPFIGASGTYTFTLQTEAYGWVFPRSYR